jgi:hypothetical protein
VSTANETRSHPAPRYRKRKALYLVVVPVLPTHHDFASGNDFLVRLGFVPRRYRSDNDAVAIRAFPVLRPTNSLVLSPEPSANPYDQCDPENLLHNKLSIAEYVRWK